MRTYPFEATNGFNWGRFMVGLLDVEWEWRSRIEGYPQRLVNPMAWGPRHIWVMDLVTGEGAWFSHGSRARQDLDKTRIHVCVLFEPFLEWLYRQDLDKIPDLAGQVVELPDAPAALWGYRRPGTVDDCEDVVRRLPSTRTSPQGPCHQDRPPAAAQVGPGFSAEDPVRR